jgi:adenosine deaminase
MGGLALSDVLAGLNEGRAAVLKQYGVQLRWMPDIVRSLPPPDDRVVAWLCGDEARRGGVVALGLGGPEAGHPPEKFQQVFDRARAAGVPANPHAGEAAGPESVWGALKALKAVRIGHGVRAIEDAALVKHLVERRIPLEVCPTSNLRLGIYPSYGEHPLKRLVEAGCVVTINSDDPVLFDTTLTDEYRHALQDCGLTLKQLEAAALNAVTRSYLPDDEKAAMLETCRTKWARLRGIEQKDAQEKRKN